MLKKSICILALCLSQATAKPAPVHHTGPHTPPAGKIGGPAKAAPHIGGPAPHGL